MQSMETIIDAPKETGNTIIDKITDKAKHIAPVSVERGVEIARGLSPVIDATIKESVRSGSDLSGISRGILIGAFRSSRFMKLEAHKTIRLLIQETLQPVFNYQGDLNKAIDGLLEGIIAIAQENKLNVQEALIIARENILFSLKGMDAGESSTKEQL